MMRRLANAFGPALLKRVGWRTVVGALLLGGIVHILATLLVPTFGAGKPFDTLRNVLPVNRMVLVPPPTPGNELLPFMPPDMLYAICRYDLTEGPVTVTAALGDSGWSLSLHSAEGDNFYVLPAQQLRRSEVSFLVVPETERTQDLAAPVKRATQSDSQIASPAMEGLIMVRAPLKGLAWRSQTEALLHRASCIQVKR